MIAFLDIETGGFNKEKHALCEIGMVIVDSNLNVIDEFQSLIYPYETESGDVVRYDDQAMCIHKINMNEIMESGCDIKYVLYDIINLITLYKVNVLAGHNINKFDFPWVNYLIKRFRGIDLGQYNTIDTLEISKQKLKGSHKLEDLCDRFGIQKGNHRALSDAKASLELYKHLIKM